MEVAQVPMGSLTVTATCTHTVAENTTTSTYLAVGPLTTQ